MKTRFRLTLITVLLGITFGPAARAQLTNSWTNNASGSWDQTTLWSLGVAPSNNQAAVLITNALTKTVTIDSTTAGIPGVMTISNLTISGIGAGVNTLFLSNAGTTTPLRILNGFTLRTNAVLLVTNSILRVDGLSSGAFSMDGSATNLSGGQIIATNTTTIVGSSGQGNLTLVDGLLQAQGIIVGSLAGSQGTLTMAGGTNILTSFLEVGGNANSTGAVWLTGGQLTVTNGFTQVGLGGLGQMTASNSAWLAGGVAVGTFGGSQGTLTVAGGTNTLSSFLQVGGNANSTGAVWLTGGQLTVTNNSTQVGNGGVGQMTVSNGTWLARDVQVGVGAVSRGTLTLVDGTNTLSSFLQVGGNANSTGAVWLTGGQLTVTNNFTEIGVGGVGQMTVSNGTWLAREIYVGFGAVSQGTLTVAGGTSSVFSNLIIGGFPCAPTGTVVVAGGNLFATNAAGNAVLEVRTGSLILNSGVLIIDKLVMTNACGHFVHTGGTLIYGTAVLDPSRDDDGDGLPNGWEQTFGLDPLDPSGNNGAAGDPDGDGQSNLAEYQAGTVPTIDIKSIKREGNDIRITWEAAATKTNALQFSTGDANGSYSNNFADIFIVTNNVGSVTNYLDGSAATNVPSRYYRVRLVP